MMPPPVVLVDSCGDESECFSGPSSPSTACETCYSDESSESSSTSFFSDVDNDPCSSPSSSDECKVFPLNEDNCGPPPDPECSCVPLDDNIPCPCPPPPLIPCEHGDDNYLCDDDEDDANADVEDAGEDDDGP